MAISQESREQLVVRLAVLVPHLGERQRRLLMGTEARIMGHGGIRAVAQAAGVSETTVRKGVDELEAGAGPPGRVRRPGGGRKRAAEVDEGLRLALLVGRAGYAWGPDVAAALDDEVDVQARRNSPGRATVSRRTPWATCCARRASVCRPTARRPRAASTPTATRSSATSTNRPAITGTPEIR